MKGLSVQDSRMRKASVLLFDKQRNSRHVTRCSLQMIGFVDIIDTSDLATALDYIGNGKPDLIIADISSDADQICESVQKLRYREIGTDPFVAIILTAWNPSNELVRKAINSGADDILGKPLSTQRINERIQAILNARKPFVVTNDYIGPDRRKSKRIGGQVAELVQVPNTLRAKVLDDPDSLATQDRIEKTFTILNEQRIQRHDYQLRILAYMLIDEQHNAGLDASWKRNLDKLIATNQEMAERARKSRYAHIAHLCQALDKVARGLMADIGTPRFRKNLELLDQITMALHLSIDPDDNTIKAAEDIANTIATIRKKQEKKAAG